MEHTRTDQSVGRLQHRGMGGYLRGGFYGIQCARRYCSSRRGWLLRVRPLNKQEMEHSRTNLSTFKSGYQVFDWLKMFTRSISLISGFGMKGRVVFVEISHQRCFCDSWMRWLLCIERVSRHRMDDAVTNLSVGRGLRGMRGWLGLLPAKQDADYFPQQPAWALQ
jgi:hypothetical protein